MFHRVKPETDQSETQKNAPATSENSQTTREVSETKEPAKAPEKAKAKVQEQATTKTTTSTQNSQPQKDEKTMNTTDKPMNTETTTPTFQRPTAAQGQAGYASSYAAPAYTPSPKAEEPVADVAQGSSDRTLTIGRGITMSGEIEACDYLLVEGTVEAALKGASVLDISETGTFYGTVEINEATVAGRFEGDLTVQGRLTIRAGGVVTGSISYGELEVEAGAIIDGRMTPMAASQPATASRPAPAKKPSAKVSAAEDQQAANSDGELFSNRAAS